VFSSAPGSVQLAFDWPEPPLYGEPFHIIGLAGGLTVGDLVVLVHLCSRFEAERPADRRVPVSLGEIARWLGAREVGGKNRSLALAGLERLNRARFSSRLLLPTAGGPTISLVKGWGLIDGFAAFTHGRGRGWVTLSQHLAGLLMAGSVVLLDRWTLEELFERSRLATRLWVWLEGERVPMHPVALFASREGEPPAARRMPAVADLLLLRERRRRNVVARIRSACRVIERVDPRSRLEVRQAREPACGTSRRAATRRPG
jgi:hypothetical protein